MTRETPCKAQRDRFIDAAREFAADEDEAALKAKLAQIARVMPKDELVKPAKPKDR